MLDGGGGVRIWDPDQVRRGTAKQSRLLGSLESDQIQKTLISHMVINLQCDFRWVPPFWDYFSSQ